MTAALFMVQAQDSTELACDIAVNISWLTTCSDFSCYNLYCMSVNISTVSMQTLNLYGTVVAFFTGCLILLAKDRQGYQLPTEPLREPTPVVWSRCPYPFHLHPHYVSCISCYWIASHANAYCNSFYGRFHVLLPPASATTHCWFATSDTHHLPAAKWCLDCLTKDASGCSTPHTLLVTLHLTLPPVGFF